MKKKIPFSNTKTNLYFLCLALVLGIIHIASFGSDFWQRALINYDDIPFLEPLRNMSLNKYLTEWLPSGSHDAFPLRDLSFWFDFRLGEFLGFETFWITSLVLFFITVIFIFRLLKTIFPKSENLVFFFTSVIALNPISVQVIQWAIVRKHILISLFIAWGTTIALNLVKKDKKLTGKNWLSLFACYLASLACFPTAVLWIFWVFFLFRKQLLKKRLQGLGIVALGTVLVVFYVLFFMTNHEGYSEGVKYATSTRHFSSVWYLGWRAFSRGAFNLLIPTNLSIYYDPQSILNYLGVGILILGFFILYKHFIKTGIFSSQNKILNSIVVLFLCLAVPQFYIIIVDSDFILSDRYLYVLFPYVLLIFLLCLVENAQVVRFFKKINSKVVLSLAFAVLASFSILSYLEAPYWQTDYTIMKHCSEKEGAPRCVSLMIEKGFDAGGCPAIMNDFALARKVYKNYRFPGWNNFRVDLPLYESLCMAIYSVKNTDEKLAELEDLFQFYSDQTTVPIYFSEVLIYLQAGDLNKAFEVANLTYLNSDFQLSNLNKKIMNIFDGQAQYLCSVLPESSGCTERLRLFLERRASIAQNQQQIIWAYRISEGLAQK